MLDLRRRHLPEQLAVLPDRCVIGFHKAAGILGEVLIEPVADPDAAFAESVNKAIAAAKKRAAAYDAFGEPEQSAKDSFSDEND